MFLKPVDVLFFYNFGGSFSHFGGESALSCYLVIATCSKPDNSTFITMHSMYILKSVKKESIISYETYDGENRYVTDVQTTKCLQI